MRIIVCGGRNYRDKAAVFRALDALHAKRGISAIIQGGADGADYLAWQWGDERGIPCGTFNADWKAHGKSAGPIRNQKMIDESSPDGVVAFPGGRGTADMIQRAEAAGLRVWHPYGQPHSTIPPATRHARCRATPSADTSRHRQRNRSAISGKSSINAVNCAEVIAVHTRAMADWRDAVAESGRSKDILLRRLRPPSLRIVPVDRPPTTAREPRFIAAADATAEQAGR